MSADSAVKAWYAVYTKPRWEKKVHQLFRQKGLDTYCPMSKVRKQWSDRIKLVEEPLFTSYVFVKITPEDQARVRMIEGVVNFVYWCGKPAIIREDEITVIRKFLKEHQSVELVSLELRAGGQAVVQQGLFMNERGVVVKVLKNKVELRLERLGCALVATIDRSNVSPVRN